MKKLLFGWLILGILVISFLVVFIYKYEDNQIALPQITGTPTSFEECNKEWGSKLLESFPRVCISKNGEQFTEDISLIPTPSPVNKDNVGCKTTGCSGTVCIDEDANDVITTCEYREEYACYEMMTCERQADGECGWTASEASDSCFAENVIEPTT